jgi:TonB family protein
MSAVSNRRVLRIALAISLAVHLVIAAVIYSRPVTAAPEQPPQRTQIVRLIAPPPTPTPQPPKHARTHVQQRARRAVRAAVHVLHVAANPHTIGPPIAAPVEPTPEPYPDVDESAAPETTSAPIIASPTPKPACSAPDIAAKTIDAQSPEVPDDVRDGFIGTAKVRVDLDAAGKVVGASIYESTGSVPLDQAAIAAARESRYAPEERDCKNVAGSYLFTIDFQ